MSNILIYAMYGNSKVKPDARVRVLDCGPDTSTVRVTSNHHPKLRHGAILKVATSSMHNGYSKEV